eukprot:CAMPEP_0113709998 /NCGR_PEP_ID=MMETSP0038_2-20120614/29901_1 /TAXON_ID=2898 /ORGANISM="Cryptomonas paramecium" /LENGTH=344 /DNA_ID=CAMNT_0000635983 /DNA_START=281 /DNA_END=1312 /DNA_ORIENTATION=- /assembly_acc=CAM_ASM_000170
MWIGILLSVIGNVIINAGMNAMKHAHNINQDQHSKEPIKHFASIPWWWFGILGIGGGEVGNLIAYGYAPAAIVTPIGAVGVLTNVLITTFILKEHISVLNMVGMLGVLGGIVLAVFYAPNSDTIFTSEGFWSDVISSKQGIIYIVIFVVAAVIMIIVNKYFGSFSVIVPVFTSSIFGSLTILSAKTFSSLLTKAISYGFDYYFLSPVPYLAFLLMLVSCVVAMAFINTAMIKFGNSKVVPTYYAFFTTLSVLSVGLVFREFDCFRGAQDAGLFAAGVFLAILGVSLVQIHSCPADNKVAPDSGDKDGEKAVECGKEVEDRPRGSRPPPIRTPSSGSARAAGGET